ncbi:hypothetical protein EMIHUDRAFT_215619 [Emiliania huxleyi CCMP1516]|uniref:Uncharacterized protein n=2 Tax=Emiliania huxleyi TaxID=2903 RepID=A0A0D3IGN9_EMIH1|nr:hypothetical protein EMIHUDRAFT_215619 [Emiliania huxleyi CCMP1516]EOD10424.1 hypothetical protein EMIHUDRAFT_215619 [Emiliania huxleyi CCMP1516]|eukprot:XP_005762853.1 hypothetical protein EMIHUDRAFT_215619 [Emiliania huxleyi CCMP1516]
MGASTVLSSRIRTAKELSAEADASAKTAGKARNALRLYEEASALCPAEPRYAFGRALMHLKLHEAAEAQAVFNELDAMRLSASQSALVEAQRARAHEVAAGEFIEVCIEAASQDACAASRVELQARRAESELRALLVEGPDDADVIKLLAQSTAALEALETESEPGAAHADRTARTEQADDARQPGNAPEESPQGQRQRPPAGLSALPVAPGPVAWLVRVLKLDCCGLGAAAADGAGSGTLRDAPHRPLQRVASSKDPAPPRPQHNQGLGRPP